jgi:hypothetical protein
LVKRVGKLLVCLAGGLVLDTGLRAEDVVPPDNPYSPIVMRNVFDLNPLPPPGAAQANVEPPPKIALNGIISHLGHWQVLFKVNIPPKPGQPAKERAYILGEGQQQDDIEVVKIDAKTQIVTFNNHGMVQELPLIVANASGPGASGPGPGGPGPVPVFPRPGFMPGGNSGPGGGLPRFGQGGGFNRPSPNVNAGNSAGYNAGDGMNSSANLSSSLGVATAGGGGYSSPSSSSGSQSTPLRPLTLTADQQAAIAAQNIANLDVITPHPPANSGSR